ncbi:MAG: hypothetical protein AEth_01485 [Candidatus Argoarchaeum ethanivorans]|uniref:Big-1 domain-containing protein n=1 Tax=Candidatus Argoarchaeum ethanivorans TaxID=2608793 RepID=A0A8B3S1L1_9EURY|nr:MAG: hypothetical protein AEth_01485 [Candidatus Argoarchaeum ethanivorans]
MTKKTKVKGNKGTRNVINGFVILTIVLSVLVASVATVIAPPLPPPPPPPPEPTSIAVTADPASIPANEVATSIITAQARCNNSTPASGHTLTFKKISGPADAVLVGADEDGEVYIVTDEEGKACATLLAGETPGTVVVKASYSGGAGEVSNTTAVNLTELEADTTPPYTSGYDPAKDATNVPIDTNIVVHVKDDDEGVNQATIEMRVDGVLVVPVITGPTADYTLTYNPPADFGYEQIVEVTVDAADFNATPNVMPQDVYSFTTQAATLHDVNLTVDNETKLTTPGVTVTYTLTVKNTGNVNDMFNLVIDDVPENATATLSESVTPDLAPDGTYNVLLNVSGAIEAEYIVNVTATSQGNTSVSDNVTAKTNVTQVPANITYSDLIVAPTSGTAPLDITASATVENTGGVAGAYNATLKVNGTVVNYTTGTLDAGENTTVNFTHTLTTAGTYNVTIDALTAVEVTVTQVPANITYSDLIVAPTSGTAPLDITASATVENTGGVAGAYNATLKVNGTVVNYTTGTLDAGENTTVNFTHTLTTAGTYNVTIDALTAVEVTVTQVPANITYSDLIVAPTSGTAPLDITASATVENTGGVAGAYNATLKVNGTVVNYTTGTLDAGENTTVNFTHTLTTAGTYNVTINDLTSVTVNAAEELPPVTVSIGSASCNVSDTVHVPINITGASNIGAMDITVTYDASILDATNVENGSMITTLPDLLWSYNLSAGMIHISLAAYPSMINGTGELFVVTFDVDAVGNSTLDINVTEAWTGDVPPQLVTSITVDGYVNVTDDGLLGDINSDGWIGLPDLSVLGGVWGTHIGQAEYNPNADLNGDDWIGLPDLSILGAHWGEHL